MPYDYSARNRRRRGEFKNIIRAAKSKPCADCGIQYPYYVMDLDHIIGEKKFAVSQAITVAGSIVKLIAEIAKCEVVCSNCHRFRTYNRGVAGSVEEH